MYENKFNECLSWQECYKSNSETNLVHITFHCLKTCPFIGQSRNNGKDHLLSREDVDHNHIQYTVFYIIFVLLSSNKTNITQLNQIVLTFEKLPATFTWLFWFTLLSRCKLLLFHFDLESTLDTCMGLNNGCSKCDPFFWYSILSIVID